MTTDSLFNLELYKLWDWIQYLFILAPKKKNIFCESSSLGALSLTNDKLLIETQYVFSQVKLHELMPSFAFWIDSESECAPILQKIIAFNCTNLTFLTASIIAHNMHLVLPETFYNEPIVDFHAQKDPNNPDNTENPDSPDNDNNKWMTSTKRSKKLGRRQQTQLQKRIQLGEENNEKMKLLDEIKHRLDLLWIFAENSQNWDEKTFQLFHKWFDSTICPPCLHFSQPKKNKN